MSSIYEVAMANLLDSFLFFFLSMFILAVSLYLPHHVSTIASRAWFYYAGDEAILSAAETISKAAAATMAAVS